MKRFRNNLYIKGPQSLLKAFASELEKLGWGLKEGMDFGCYPATFSSFINALFCQKKGVFYGQSYMGNAWALRDGTSKMVYPLYLPQDWDKALALAAETEEDIPEYVELQQSMFGYLKGDIAKIIARKIQSGDYIVSVPGRVSTSDAKPFVIYSCTKDWVKPSTKEAYHKHQEKLKVQELIEEAKEKYPVGTIFLDLIQGKKFRVKAHNFTTSGNNTQLHVSVEQRDSSSNKTARLYRKGEWAKIIPRPEGKLPFKVGDFVTLVRRPSTWSGKRFTQCGLDEVKYPYVFQVKEIERRFMKDDSHIAIFDGTYGWTYYPELFKLTTVDIIEIAGHIARIKENTVSIGCYKDITLKELKTLKRAIRIASKFQVDFEVTQNGIIELTEGKEIYLNEINLLIKKLNDTK